MVFQDGVHFYQDFVPTVFDNLIAEGAMPPTVGIFLDPGVFADTTVSNRSFEYDTLSDQYVRFLLEEILPEVARERPLREDAAGRAICGISSGGICAFTAAWQRPDQFHKVLSHVGSFTNIASGPTQRDGGHNYPALIRRLPPKPIRVALQDGENDLNVAAGNWWLANLQMDRRAALRGLRLHLHRRAGLPLPRARPRDLPRLPALAVARMSACRGAMHPSLAVPPGHILGELGGVEGVVSTVKPSSGDSGVTCAG